MAANNPQTGRSKTTSDSIASSTLISSNTAFISPSVTSSSAASNSHASKAGGTSPGNSNFSSSVLAGGIVGAALGAALISILLTSLFCLQRMKHQKSSSQRRSRSGRSDYVSSFEKPVSAVVSPYNWEKYLPQPIEDHTISRTVKTLFDEIQLHVENFYSRSTNDLSFEAANNLTIMQSHLDAIPIAKLLEEAESSLPIIKHCLSYMVASSIGISAAADLSLLPCGWSMPIEESEASEQRMTAKRQATRKWRQLTAYLHPNPNTHPSIVANRESTVSAMAEKFTTAFRPWQNNGIDVANENLKAVLRNAAHVSFILFSQPSSFDFRWQARRGRGGTGSERDIVVIPALMKVADENGERLAQAQILIDMVTERL
ncbi:hypothetical protein M433DRAFT_27063 [Acidomyces richmondensis BFW]|nr:hypothetical protein M433DRAFT_27063 [Acidomyces richmondensis BFW]